jgi:tetratricopeptide (TPR) repeat protein
MGQLSEADECWFKAYSLEPAKATPEEHIHLGDNFLRQNQVTQAIRCYCHAIELNPNSNEAYQQLGNALKAQKKVQEEVASYRKIIERPANIFGDLFKTVVVSLNPKLSCLRIPKHLLCRQMLQLIPCNSIPQFPLKNLAYSCSSRQQFLLYRNS